MFKSLIVYRIAPDFVLPGATELEDALQGQRFVECGPTQAESAGWVEPRGEKHGAMLEVVDGQRILKLCVQTKAVPASAVKDELEKRAAKHLDETGRKLGAKAKKELKEAIVHEMLPRAFAKTGATLLWIDARNQTLVVGAGSIKKADRITTALVEAIKAAGGHISLNLLNTKMSASAGMSHWLKTQEAPYEFSVDRECELKDLSGEKAAVRYSRHNLEIQEVVEHIAQGKTPTKLAMTWGGRVSFVLGGDLSLKKVELLDVALADKATGADAGFDADVVLTTSELAKLIPALVNALDGEIDYEDLVAAGDEPPAEAATNPLKNVVVEAYDGDGKLLWSADGRRTSGANDPVTQDAQAA